MKLDFSPTRSREFLDYTGMAPISPTGLWGAPSKATPEEGEHMLRESARRADGYIRENFAETEHLDTERGAGKEG